MHIYLIRHAESESNMGQTYGHPEDIRLTARGTRQACTVASALRSIEKIIVSDFARSQQTAEPVREKFPEAEYKVWHDVREFTYLDPRKFTTITSNKKQNLVEEYWERMDPFFADGGEAETFANFVDRVRRCIANLRKEILTTCVITHGNFIKLLLLLLSNHTEYIFRKSNREEIEMLMRAFYGRYKNEAYEIRNAEIIDITKLLQVTA